jgi:hypothetical protein
MTIRVLLADDNEITRRGLTWIMDSSPDVTVCGEAVDGEEAVARAGESFSRMWSFSTSVCRGSTGSSPSDTC